MTNYINADKLKEIVTRLITSARQNDWPIAEDYLRRVIDIIDSLHQERPEVDLEKEIDKYYGMYRDKAGKTYDAKDDEPCFDWKEDELSEHEMRIAHHFYALGLNARK